MGREMIMVLHVDESKVGSLIADLQGRVKAIEFDFPKKSKSHHAQPEATRPRGGPKSEAQQSLVLGALNDGPLSSRKLRAAVGPHLKDFQFYAALQKLRVAGIVKKNGMGHWEVV